jgi:hypothetical protein
MPREVLCWSDLLADGSTDHVVELAVLASASPGAAQSLALQCLQTLSQRRRLLVSGKSAGAKGWSGEKRLQFIAGHANSCAGDQNFKPLSS